MDRSYYYNRYDLQRNDTVMLSHSVIAVVCCIHRSVVILVNMAKERKAGAGAAFGDVHHVMTRVENTPLSQVLMLVLRMFV